MSGHLVMAIMNFIKRLARFFVTFPYNTSRGMDVRGEMGVSNARFRFERVDEKVIADRRMK